MKIGKDVWNKNVSNEEKEATKKALVEHFNKIEKSGKNLELKEELDSFESRTRRPSFPSVNKKGIENKIFNLDKKIKDLEKEIVKLQEIMTNADTNKEQQDAIYGIQDRQQTIENNGKKIREKKEEIEKLKNDLMIAGKVVPGVEAGQENLN